jgi:CRP/FNR family cyclic AMP-dependent transcriptional regulator
MLLDYATRVAVQSRGWLSNLPPSLCDELLRVAVVVRLPAGHRLFASGDRAEGLWLCASGYLRLSRASGGRRRTLAYAAEGDLVGAPGFFLGTQECDAHVHSDVTLLFLGRTDMQCGLNQWPQLSQAMLTVLARQVRCLGEDVCDARYLPLDALMAKRLAELWRQHGQAIHFAGPAKRIKLAMAQSELGELIGYSRQHVNASLKRLERRGLIAVTTCGIVVRDPAGLRAQFAEQRGPARLASDPLEDRRNPLPTADAHGDQGVLAADAVQFVDRLHGDQRTGGADRVAE